MLKTNKLYTNFILSTLLFLWCAIDISAQTTKVNGKIVDAISREPLPFVNIIFKGTNIGATSDIEGKYTISATVKVDSLVISYIGYTKVTRAVKYGITQEINIGLSQGIELAAIEVRPGENPAHPILRKIIANKDKNDREKYDYYEYEVYNKVEFDLNNLSEDFQNKKLLKPFSFIFDNIDSSNTKEKPYLPVFMTESLSDFYYRKNPKTRNEKIKASKVAGVENASVSQFMGDMYQNVNIYDNNILVFGKNFISPISDNALLFYKFYLIDSIVIDGHKCYQLQFKPRRKQELTFTGNLWAADTSFAIKQIEMSIADDANINFINATNVVQTYIQVDSLWMMEKERLVIDFNPFPIEQKNKNLMGIYGRKTASYNNFKINKPKDDKFYSMTENLVVAEDAFEKNEDFWDKNRHDTLSKNEKQIYHMVDTLQSLPVYKTWIDVLQIFVTGYKVKGNFEYGPYYNMFSFNTIEGNRFRFGVRTSNQFSKWYELSGYLAYGTRDEQFKYKLGIRAFIDKKPRTMVGLYYKNDNEILGQSQNGFTTDNILASVLRITPLRNLTRVKEVNAYIEREWFTGFNTKLSFYNRQMFPLANFHYEYQKNSNQIAYKDKITTSEIRVLARLAYNEKYIDGAFTRTSLGTHYPIVQAQYTLGIKNLFNSDYDYHKLVVNVDDRIRINPIGYFDYILEYGKIWNKTPYPLLELHGGNETYTYDPYAYNSMNFYEFVSDEYASASIQHHFDGFFLNRIPLMRKLKWREVVGGKALIGRVNAENKKLLLFPDHLYELNRGPFFEANVGIENIFKVFRLDGVYRLSYLDNPRVTPFSIRFSFQFSF
ncbi:MAG: carboxypeptidase-like regulatory domain-containing protein [Bacteroidia bacterium]|nr:carboxypeptidase-like regulatory domain-containing protein [Bacteroidia bacterium]